MKFERSCGILLHITSLPGRHGIGTMGREAYEFADFLKRSGQSYWQILPTGPVCADLEYSPYGSTSTFAGNPMFINTDAFAEKRWVPSDALRVQETYGPAHYADFGKAEQWVLTKMAAVYSAFLKAAPADDHKAFEKFCADAAWWLDDYALYASLAAHFKTVEWNKWDDDIRLRKPAAIAAWTKKLTDQISFQKYLQFVFAEQWHNLKKYCNNLGIKIIGDIPIYVSFNSADAWAHPEIFDLDPETGKPHDVAGVPPDYFSPKGQLWGNPLYRWKDKNGALAEPTVTWWVARLRQVNSFVDVIRIDHFRAFEDYWAIPAGSADAMNGKWRPGPGLAFFTRIEKELGELPFIAEDLGIITPAVEKLRDDTGFPGMKILQFAFDGKPKNPYLPCNFSNPNCVVYTGTHDNETTNGWYYASGLDDQAKHMVREYMGFTEDSDFHLKMIRWAYGSVAQLAVIPAQDILGYGKGFRMNTPGVYEGNWVWMLTPGALNDNHVGLLHWLAQIFNRLPA